jgi:uncharacterized Zn finger protein
MSEKQLKSGVCEQCGNNENEIMRFSDEEIFRCSYCMTVEGLCQECGKYIPLQDSDDDDEYDMNYAPSLCERCDY